MADEMPEKKLYVIAKTSVALCTLALATVIALGVEVVPYRFWFVVAVLLVGSLVWSGHQHNEWRAEQGRAEARELKKSRPSGPKRLEDFEK